MKKLLKRWLEIPAKPDYVSRADVCDVVAADIRGLVLQVLSSPAELGWWQHSYLPREEHEKIFKLLDEHINAPVSSTAKKVAMETVEEYIQSEAFLDDIVDRVKRKQLS